MVESIVWTIDWNPEFEGEARLKREILRALNDPKTIATVKRFGQFAVKEASEDGMETEHIVWLDSALDYAFFVRVWYEAGEQKLFVLVEENDLGDIGFLIFDDLECASYEQDEDVLRVELRDPDDLGISP